MGAYEENDEFIEAHTDDGKYNYIFYKEWQDIVFIADKSSEMPKFTYSATPTN